MAAQPAQNRNPGLRQLASALKSSMLQLMSNIPSGPHDAPASLPLGKRPLDIVILAYLIFNLVAITYLFDLEQILIPDTSHFVYPAWPPRFIVDLSHWWGRNFDPLLYARPPWWRATIWIDAVLFGPYSVFAIYAFIRGRNWIRMPSIIYASVMLTNVTIIMSEEIWGAHATPHLAAVIGANASWVVVPLLILFRMRRDPFPAVSGR